jgi:hypothetical protein
MSENFAFDNMDSQPGKSTQEVLRQNIDTALDDYFMLLSRRGLDEDRAKLDRNIQDKRQLLIQLSQQLDSQLELDDTFSEQINIQLGLAEKGIETGRQELTARTDGLDNVEAIIADMRAYMDMLNRVDLSLDSIKDTLENKQIERQEIEELVFELKTMIKAFMKLGGEIQRLILLLKVDNKEALVQRQLRIMNDVVQAIKNFDEISKDKDELNKIKGHFYEHFDEALHFYEELRDQLK